MPPCLSIKKIVVSHVDANNTFVAFLLSKNYDGRTQSPGIIPSFLFPGAPMHLTVREEWTCPVREGGTEDGVALHVQAPSKAQKGVHRQQAVTSARPVRRRGADGDLWEENKLFILSCWLNSRLHKRMCHAGLLMSFSACCVICATWVWITVCWVWVGGTHGWRLTVQIPTDTRWHSDTQAIEATNSVKASLSNLFDYTCILAFSVTCKCGPSRGQTCCLHDDLLHTGTLSSAKLWQCNRR